MTSHGIDTLVNPVVITLYAPTGYCVITNLPIIPVPVALSA